MVSNIQGRLQNEINGVAQIHFYIRCVIEASLRSTTITPEGKAIVGEYNTALDHWRGTFADKFFDMSTTIRLGTAIEICLRTYYMDRKSYATLIDLRNDARYKKGIFQRVQNWQGANGVISLYRSEIGYDLTTNSHLLAIQEAMMHRHLYAHNSGLLDDEYIDKIQQITGEDIRTHPSLAQSNYPADDVYWFEPLDRLNVHIEEARRFFRQFPS
jgi:hypothetical protein